jgi:hypothetical protein
VDTFELRTFELGTLGLRSFRLMGVTLLAGATLFVAGCKQKPVDDATLTQNVQTAIKNDTTIAQQPVQVGVQQGVVTLTGNVSDETASSVAAQDAARVKGVKEVVNDLEVAGMQVAPTVTSPAAPTNPRPTTAAEQQTLATGQTLPPPPNGEEAPAPPPPVYKQVTLPTGREIPVRINQSLNSGDTPEGAAFNGVVTREVVEDGMVVIPAGSAASGHVVVAKDSGHFKGHAELSIELTALRRHGTVLSVSTDPYTVESHGRGKGTAEKVGGGAAIGAVLGGIFGGGKGAAIGAAAGAGGGAAVQGLSHAKEVSISSESVIPFRLAHSISVSTAETPSAPPPPGLQRR